MADDGGGRADGPELPFQRFGYRGGDGCQQAAGGLGVEEDLLHGEGYAVEPDPIPHIVAVPLGGGGEQELVGMVQRLLEDRHPARLNDGAELSVEHLVEMAQEAEAGDVGTGVDRIAPEALGGVFI